MAEQTYGEWIRSNPPMPTKNLNTKHMAQQTAVEWFIDNAFEEGFLWVTDKPAMFELNLIIEKAKEMEKQQHGETWDAAIKAHDDRGHVHARSLVDFDEYYEQQFKK